MSKLKDVIQLLLDKKTNILQTQYKDHLLKGQWQGYRELHIENDWLLIYKIDSDNLILTLVRTGSHDNLF
jgi:mRNA interferase YafQ